MQIVETTADSNVLDTSGRETYHLGGERRYVLYDQEASFGLRDGALELVEAVDRIVPFYAGGPLDADRLILPFIGRKGDAIVTSSCLAALKDRHPRITIDITATPDALEVFELCPHLGELIPYPLEAKRLSAYDYYMSFEEVESIRMGADRSCADVFASCLGTPRPARPARVRVPSDAAAKWRFEPSERPNVAIHVGDQSNVRSLPIDIVQALTARLSEDGCHVYLVGEAPSPDGESRETTSRATCLIGRTPRVADLAAVLAGMQALVTGDSFPMHLAGALGVETLAIFTSTAAVLASDYMNITAIQSREACSPCHVTNEACPMQLGSCEAHRHPGLTPERLASRVQMLLSTAADATSTR